MSTNPTNEILREALHDCADETDKIVPGKGQQLKDFADELYGNAAKNPSGAQSESPLPAQVEGLATPRPWQWKDNELWKAHSKDGLSMKRLILLATFVCVPAVAEGYKESILAALNAYGSTKAKVEALTGALKLLSVRINPKDSQCMHCWCNTWDWTKHSLKCEAIRAALIKSPTEAK